MTDQARARAKTRLDITLEVDRQQYAKGYYFEVRIAATDGKELSRWSEPVIGYKPAPRGK